MSKTMNVSFNLKGVDDIHKLADKVRRYGWNVSCIYDGGTKGLSINRTFKLRILGYLSLFLLFVKLNVFK